MKRKALKTMPILLLMLITLAVIVYHNNSKSVQTIEKVFEPESRNSPINTKEVVLLKKDTDYLFMVYSTCPESSLAVTVVYDDNNETRHILPVPANQKTALDVPRNTASKVTFFIDTEADAKGVLRISCYPL